ncbi:MAG: serine/threonine protein kinase [Acidobacteriia bacterium]|nr:serine/threonine protein kinase [Terriglobia bacterium]
MTLRNGALIGRYRVDAPIGAGGMGEVYRVTDTASGRTMALKTLPRGPVEPRVWERFLNEATIQSQLSHPAIAAFHEMFLWGELPCLIMEYVAGQTLDQVVSGTGPVPPGEAVRLLGPICEALSYLHAMGILHRDLKSSNVKLMPDGSVKLIDFGIARFRSAARMTQVGAVAGTPEMLAPELLRGRLADEASEIWGLGVLGYEMLTGRLPFAGAAVQDVYRQILEDDPVPPSELNPAVPANLDLVIMRCLSKNPAKRYRTCDGVRRALAGKVLTKREEVIAVSRRPGTWKRAVLAAGVAVALWVGARGVAGLWRPAAGERTVTIEAVGGAAEVYREGRLLGHTPYTRHASPGETISVELRREGSAPLPVQFEVSQRNVYSYTLSPVSSPATGR